MHKFIWNDWVQPSFLDSARIYQSDTIWANKPIQHVVCTGALGWVKPVHRFVQLKLHKVTMATRCTCAQFSWIVHAEWVVFIFRRIKTIFIQFYRLIKWLYNDICNSGALPRFFKAAFIRLPLHCIYKRCKVGALVESRTAVFICFRKILADGWNSCLMRINWFCWPDIVRLLLFLTQLDFVRKLFHSV